MSSPISSIILPVYNPQPYLEKCLDSLLAQETDAPFEVIVVDDSSPDDCADFVRASFPQVSLVINERNRGHAEACNIGARNAQGKYLVFIDQDTYFEPNWLSELVKLAKSDKEIGVVCGKVRFYDEPDALWEIGLTMDLFGFVGYYVKPGEKDHGQYDRIREVFHCSSCGLLIRKSVFDEVGGYDPLYYIQSEDFDLCWRVHLVGYTVMATPLAVMYHEAGGSVGGGVMRYDRRHKTTASRRYYAERNILRTMLKNYSPITLLGILPFYITLLAGEVLVYLFTGHTRPAKAVIRALLWNIKNLPDLLDKRRPVQSTRKVSDTEILRFVIKGSNKLGYFLKKGVPEFR